MKNKENAQKLINVQYVLHLIGGRWRGAVLASLCDRPRRFNELKRDMGSITSKTLIKELKFLEQNLLIVHQEQTLSEISVLYKIAPHGKTLEPLIDNMQLWAIKHKRLLLDKKKD